MTHRYSGQVAFAPIGEASQQRISGALAMVNQRKPILSPCRKRCWQTLLSVFLVASGTPLLKSETEEVKDPRERARQVLTQAIEAMGGDRYLGVKTEYVTGRDFLFARDRRSGLIPFQSWTHYQDPIRFRHQIRKGKRQTLEVYNLELDKGWIQEGFTIEEMPKEQLDGFKLSVKQDLHYLLRNRLDEEGLSFFYYGPDDIAGSGELEAVEVIDKTNDAVTIYFDIESHLPVHTETEFRDKMGLRHDLRTEFFNWHEQDGVLTPLSFHFFLDGEKSREMFFEVLTYNTQFPPEYFLEPKLPPKKAKKAEKEKNKKQPD